MNLGMITVDRERKADINSTEVLEGTPELRQATGLLATWYLLLLLEVSQELFQLNRYQKYHHRKFLLAELPN